MNRKIPNIMSLIAIVMFAVAAFIITKGNYILGAALLGGGVFINSVAGSMRRNMKYNSPPEDEDKKKKD